MNNELIFQLFFDKQFLHVSEKKLHLLYCKAELNCHLNSNFTDLLIVQVILRAFLACPILVIPLDNVLNGVKYEGLHIRLHIHLSLLLCSRQLGKTLYFTRVNVNCSF